MGVAANLFLLVFLSVHPLRGVFHSTLDAQLTKTMQPIAQIGRTVVESVAFPSCSKFQMSSKSRLQLSRSSTNFSMQASFSNAGLKLSRPNNSHPHNSLRIQLQSKTNDSTQSCITLNSCSAFTIRLHSQSGV